MAHFALTTGSEDGHFAPCLPIVKKLIERGHVVSWLTGRKYQPKIEAAGAKFFPLPEKTDSSLTDMYVFHPGLKELTGLAQIKYYLKHIFLDAAEIEIAVLDTILQSSPVDCLIGDTITFYTYFKSELSGIPSAMISLLPLALPDRDAPPFGMGLIPGNSIPSKTKIRLLNWLINYILLRDVTLYANQTRTRLGLPPLNGPFFSAMFRIPPLILHISTPSFEYPRSQMPHRLHFIGPILREKDAAYQPPTWWKDLHSGTPVVLVNQGTIATNLEDLTVPAIKALQAEPLLVVAVPVKAGQVSLLPANVRAEPFIPFEHLLPHVDIMITNGGYGGTQMALAHGIPLIVAGDTDDKMEVAARVEWSGAGINLRKQRPTPAQIHAAVHQITRNPSYRNHARRIQADFACYNAPQRAAELLEDLVMCRQGYRNRK